MGYMTLIRAELPVLDVRVYASMWIVDCPRCKNAERLTPEEPLFGCSYCGLAAQVQWPDQKFRYAVARLLSQRPIPYTRNWNPDETLHDLVLENAVHGVLGDPDQTGLVIGVDDSGIREDRLPVSPGVRRAVGA